MSAFCPTMQCEKNASPAQPLGDAPYCESLKFRVKSDLPVQRLPMIPTDLYGKPVLFVPNTPNTLTVRFCTLITWFEGLDLRKVLILQSTSPVDIAVVGHHAKG